MRHALLELLRCPYCGTRLSIVENDALTRRGDRIETGVLGCQCCAYPVVAGIPVLVADDATREAMHGLEAGRGRAALHALLGLEEPLATTFEEACAQDPAPTYRDLLPLLSRDAEADYLRHRFSDATFLVYESLLTALGTPNLEQPVLDVCGGAGHGSWLLSHLVAGDRVEGPLPGVVTVDVSFWKLWLASRFVAPRCAPVCCDANQPLPFARRLFFTVLLADAFPYIWHKRLLADELQRVATSDGLIIMPHLHSALGENFSAGDTLTPAAYQDLFSLSAPRLFRDTALLTRILEERIVDLSGPGTPATVDDEPSVTLVATRRAESFRRYELVDRVEVWGTLSVNPLYRVERRGSRSTLTLEFPTPEYEAEFGECRRYLPDTLTLPSDPDGRIRTAALGSDSADLRRRRVLLDLPPRY